MHTNRIGQLGDDSVADAISATSFCSSCCSAGSDEQRRQQPARDGRDVARWSADNVAPANAVTKPPGSARSVSQQHLHPGEKQAAPNNTVPQHTLRASWTDRGARRSRSASSLSLANVAGTAAAAAADLDELRIQNLRLQDDDDDVAQMASSGQQQQQLYVGEQQMMEQQQQQQHRQQQLGYNVAYSLDASGSLVTPTIDTCDTHMFGAFDSAPSVVIERADSPLVHPSPQHYVTLGAPECAAQLPEPVEQLNYAAEQHRETAIRFAGATISEPSASFDARPASSSSSSCFLLNPNASYVELHSQPHMHHAHYHHAYPAAYEAQPHIEQHHRFASVSYSGSEAAASEHIKYDNDCSLDDDEDGDDDDEYDEDDEDDDEADLCDDDLKRCEWDNCGHTFIALSEFVKHIEDKHINMEPAERGRFYCLWAQCKRGQKEFNARYKLQIHMRVHSGDRPYPCRHATCSKRFSRRENLKIHERSHTGEKPYKCSYESCKKSFTNSSDRIKHHKTHINPVSIYIFEVTFCGQHALY